MSAPPKDKDRCEFLFQDGRRCRRLRAAPDAPFCPFHHRQFDQDAPPVDTAAGAREIVGDIAALSTQAGIHKALANVFANLAGKRIPARDAAVLGYLGQMMLLSRPSIEQHIKFLLPLVQLSLKQVQQQQKSNAAKDDQLHKNALQELEVIKGLVGLFKTLRNMNPDEGLKFMSFITSFSDKNDSPKPPDAKPKSA